MRTLRALAALLCYPTKDLIGATNEIRTALDREALLPKAERQALERLIGELESGDLYDLQERYGLLFDRTRSLSLHLFEHVHGESRDRGQAMVDLLKLYEESGYSPVASELPDFLPLFLEYASTQAPKAAIELVGQPANVIAALRERLAKRSSSYEAVMAALLALSRAARRSSAGGVAPSPTPNPTISKRSTRPGSTGGDFRSRHRGRRHPVDRMATRLRAAMAGEVMCR